MEKGESIDMPVKPPIHRTCQPAIPADYSGIRALRSSARWQRVRAMKLNQDPLCEVCKLDGIIQEAEQVHHRIGLEKNIELAFDLWNLESVCTACHANIEQAVRQGQGAIPLQSLADSTSKTVAPIHTRL